MICPLFRSLVMVVLTLVLGACGPTGDAPDAVSVPPTAVSSPVASSLPRRTPEPVANEKHALMPTPMSFPRGVVLPITGELREILDDLAAIRAAYPDETRVIQVERTWLSFDSEGNPIPSFDLVQYDEVVTNIRNGLSYTTPGAGYIPVFFSRYMGGGNIEVDSPFYTFSASWGCGYPSGCINKQEWHYRVDDGHVTVIPEPATLSLLGIGGLAMIRRRRKHHTLQ